MHKIINVVLFLLLSTFSLNAEIARNLKVIGNERVSDETIKVYGDIELGKNYKESDLNKILQNLYSTNFFEDVQISLDEGILTIKLKEYPLINQLVILGEKNKKYLEQIKKIIKLRQKSSFIKSYLSDDIENIKRLYSSAGYNNSIVDIKTREVDNNIDLIIEISRGEITKISSINFTGDKILRDRRLRDIIASGEDKFWKIISRNTKFSENLINLDKRLLTNYYKSLGYYDVEISSNSAIINDEGNVDLIYSIEAGKRYVIKKISTNIDQVFDKNIFFDLENSYQKYIGEFYSPFSITILLKDIDEIIENNNLQFVEHNVEEKLDESKGEIEILFNIFEAKKILVERINIVGNNITNENVIRSELILDEGDPFTKLKLDKSISNLKARNIFADVKVETKIGSSNDLRNIEIAVEEKPTGEISAGAGVGTSGGNFAFNIRENNWLGEGKQVDFAIDFDEESLSGRLNFTDPNYDFLGNALNVYISSTGNDKPDQGYENTTVATGISTSFEQYKNVFATLGIDASYDDLRTFDSASASLKKQAGEFSELSGSYGFKYDKRDRKFMPTSGSVYSFNQRLPIVADKRFISNTISASGYKSFSENIIGSSKIYLSAINGIGDDDVRLSKRKNLSQRRLRGFERGKVGPVDGDDHVGGNYAAALNFEVNLPNVFPESTKTEVGLFLDFGNLWGVDYDSSLDKSNELRSSTGVAASWLSPLGPMTFIFSTNLSKASTDKTESFSFNLGTTF
tara:strand:+ start:201 stop:2435 length:2235 start_codon:yes stop_codon:yes gene_type:complete